MPGILTKQDVTWSREDAATAHLSIGWIPANSPNLAEARTVKLTLAWHQVNGPRSKSWRVGRNALRGATIARAGLAE